MAARRDEHWCVQEHPEVITIFKDMLMQLEKESEDDEEIQVKSRNLACKVFRNYQNMWGWGVLLLI